MTSVMLINCASGEKSRRTPVEHLGLGYLSAVLHEHGFKVRLVDAAFYGLNTQVVCRSVLQEQPFLAGFTVYYNNITATLAVIAKLRRSGFQGHITLGGHHATFNAAAILSHHSEINSIILGEGEGALTDLTRCLAAGRDWTALNNLVTVKNGTVTVNPCRPLIPDLNTLPLSGRWGYEEHLRRHQVAAMVSSRGCYGRCSFCSIRAFYALAPGRAWRGRNPASIVAEMEYLKQEFGIKRITFMDDDFLGAGQEGQERVLALSDELLRRRLDLGFTIVCRPDNLRKETLLSLKQAGLECVDIGVESWVPRQLALYGKQVDLAQNLAAIDILKELDLNYRLYIMPIDPYLTVPEYLQNLDAMEEAGLENFHEGSFLAQLMVFKGTALEKKLQRKGILRPCEPNSYLGLLEYDFQDPVIRRLSPFIHNLGRKFADLQDQLREIFPAETLHSEEIALGVTLKLGITRNFLAFLRRLLTCVDPENYSTEVASAVSSLNETLSQVQKAKNIGVFKRFQPCEFRLGQETLEFPSPHFRNLSQVLIKSLLE